MPRHDQRLRRGALVLFAIGLLAASWYGAELLPSAQSEGPAPAEAEATVSPQLYAHPWPGLYALVLESRVAAAGEGPLAVFRLTGALGLREAHPNDPGLWHLGFEGKFEMSGAEAKGQDGSMTALEAELERPWRIRFDAAGHVADVEVAVGLSPFSAQIWKSVAYSMQFVRATPAEPSWQTEERDTVGTYVARYEGFNGDSAQSNQASIQKTKLRYVATENGRSGLKATYHIDQAKQSFWFDAEGHWTGLDQTERLLIEGLGGLPGFTSTSELHLDATPGAVPSELGDAQLSYESALTARDPRDVLGPARLQGLPWSEVLARLHQFATASDPDDAQRKLAGRAYIALTEHLRQDPARIATAVRAVLEGGPLTQTWIEALRDADTPASQNALISLAQAATLKPSERMLAVRALSHVHTPSQASVSALRALDDDPRLGRQALYGVGSNIYRLREQEPQLAEQAVASLVTDLEQARSDADQIQLLIALGNAGHPAALRLAQARLDHPSDRVRAAALQAVRRVDDAAADRLLAEALADPSDNVRRSALDALSERAPTPLAVQAVNTVLMAESKPGVRAQALNLAIRWVEGAPALVEGLRHVRQHDPIHSLRKAAERSLNSSTVSTSSP